MAKLCLKVIHVSGLAKRRDIANLFGVNKLFSGMKQKKPARKEVRMFDNYPPLQEK